MENNQAISHITSIISSCKELEDIGYGRTGTRKIIRETIHFIWETGLNKETKFSKKRARSLSASKEENNKNLIYDHPIPLKIIIEMLFKLENIDSSIKDSWPIFQPAPIAGNSPYFFPSAKLEAPSTLPLSVSKYFPL